MRKFKEILEKLSCGLLIEERDIKYVKSYLGLSFGINHIIGLSILLVFVALGITIILTSYLFLGIFIILIGLILMLYFIPLNPKQLKEKYDKALENYLNVKLELNKFNFKYTKYLELSEYEIKKDKVYFIYDDYYFSVVEDLLKYEEYPKRNLIFKYPDINSNRINHIDFKLQDIMSYSKTNQNEYAKDELQDLVKTLPTGEASFRINLKDFRIINLGEEIGAYFKTIIKEKEE